MTTFTSEQRDRIIAELDERGRMAWADYNESLRDLDGRDYEFAETESWDRLQGKLRDLHEQRQLVARD